MTLTPDAVNKLDLLIEILITLVHMPATPGRMQRITKIAEALNALWHDPSSIQREWISVANSAAYEANDVNSASR